MICIMSYSAHLTRLLNTVTVRFMNNLKSTLAGLALAGGLMVPGAAEAESPKHDHPHHVAVGAEVSGHDVFANLLYTHEVLRHWSLGAGVAFGSDFHGRPAGNVKAVGTFHKGVIKPFYFVGEIGAGVEFNGSHMKPLLEVAALIGWEVNESIGFALGSAMMVTPEKAGPAAIAAIAIGFQ